MLYHIDSFFSSTDECLLLHHPSNSNSSSSVCLFDSQLLSMSEGGMIGRDLKNLPVGFRFQPTDKELVDHYLKPKILRMDSQEEIIPEVDVCKWEPWELPGFSVIKSDDLEWFFISLLDYKYSNGSRSNRATKAGYWKPTGQDRGILSGTNKEVIGTKKTLVFHRGRGREAVRTNWVIHEYRANIAGLPANRAYVLCRLKRKTDENTASDIPTPDEAGTGGFSPEINFNGVLSELPIVQETWLMNMELDNSSTDTGIHQNGLDNNITLGAGPSHHSSNIASDIGNYQLEELTLDEDPQPQGLLNDIALTPPGSDWFSDIEKELDLDLPSPTGFNNSYASMQFQDWVDTEFADGFIIDPDECHCEGLTHERSSAVDSWNPDHVSVSRLLARPQSPLKGEHGKGGGSSSNTDTEVLQGFCLQAKDGAEYDSVTDLLQKKNPIGESKKDSKVTEKASRKLSSIWNEPVGKDQDGSFSSRETASASHDPSSSSGYLVNLLVGTNQPIITKKRRINEKKHVCFFSSVEIS